PTRPPGSRSRADASGPGRRGRPWGGRGVPALSSPGTSAWPASTVLAYPDVHRDRGPRGHRHGRVTAVGDLDDLARARAVGEPPRDDVAVRPGQQCRLERRGDVLGVAVDDEPA